jgi:hypothetical protein
MKHGSDDMPIACCLTSAELRKRQATLFAQFRSAVIETEELPDGFNFPEADFRPGITSGLPVVCPESPNPVNSHPAAWGEGCPYCSSTA